MAEIGATLREARLRAKIDINEVEAGTKIRAKYLRAIENEEWDLLPGDVYVKSFLRTYGDYLGVDTRQLLDDFRRRYERPTDHELRPIAPLGRDRERERRPRRPPIPPWLLVGVVLVGVVAALYFVGNGTKNNTSTSSTTSAKGARHHRRHHHGTPATPKPTTVKLELVPTGQVYVCLVNGSGKQLIPGQIFNTGQTIPVETATKLLLTLGNNSVKMKVNGTNVAVSASSSSIGYEFVPGSSKVIPTAQQPRCA
ncbi:MAG TPA: helix-turn-helix domain-containing protein [Solirubrobacteraceae bacterium]|jgi:cytoskeletal protein RodZ